MNTRIPVLAALILALASLSDAQPQKPGPDPRPQPTPQPGQREPGVGPPSGPLKGPIQAPALKFFKFPPRSVPVLGRLPICIRPTQDVTSTTNMPCQQQAGFRPAPDPPDHQIPPLDLEVSTSGGIAPVHISFEAGKFNDRFELVTPPAPAPGPGSGKPGIVERPRPDLTVRGSPAEAVRRIIRFKGLPDWAGSPQEIVVQVSAKDGQGQAATNEFRIYPYSPRVELVASPQMSTFVTIAPRFELRQIGAATEVSVEEIFASRPCRWAEHDLPRGHLVGLATRRERVKIEPRTGQFTLVRLGILHADSSGGSGSPCHFGLVLRFTFPFQENRASEPHVRLKAGSFGLAPRQTYRITNTWQLKERFDWFGPNLMIRSGLGVCRGKSEPGGHPVGVLETNGDLSFQIRSGPIGTRCNFLEPSSRLLPGGMRLDDVSWKVITTPKCRAPDMSRAEVKIEEFGLLDYNFERRDPSARAPGMGQVGSFGHPLMDPLNSGVELLSAGNPGTFRTVLRPLEVRLECDATLVNDHSVRMILDEITFTGPPGLTFP